MWNEHVWKRQTVHDLTEKYGLSEKTIRTRLDDASVRQRASALPQAVVCIFDASHFGEETLLVARAPKLKANLGWAWIASETKETYAGLRAHIESKGYKLQGAVLDGRTGIPKVFSDIPVQICQFHQLQIVRRKLTLRPETEAGVALLSIGFSLARSDEPTLAKELSDWHTSYKTFMDERTYTVGTKRWRYTHRRVRSAYLSLQRNLPFLFTYQKYPALEIPNTTNSLDGYWSRVKNLLSAHRGKSTERMKKIVTEILRKQTA